MSLRIHLAPGMHFRFNDTPSVKPATEQAKTVEARTEEVMRGRSFAVTDHNSEDDSPKMEVKKHKGSDDSDSDTSTHSSREMAICKETLGQKRETTQIEIAKEALSHFSNLSVWKDHTLQTFVLEQTLAGFLKEHYFSEDINGKYQISEMRFQQYSWEIVDYFREFSKYLRGENCLNLIDNKKTKFKHDDAHYLLQLNESTHKFLLISEILMMENDEPLKRNPSSNQLAFNKAFKFVIKFCELSLEILTRPFKEHTKKIFETKRDYKEIYEIYVGRIKKLNDEAKEIFQKIEFCIQNANYGSIQQHLNSLDECLSSFRNDLMKHVPQKFDSNIYKCDENVQLNLMLIITKMSVMGTLTYLNKYLTPFKIKTGLKESVLI